MRPGIQHGQSSVEFGLAAAVLLLLALGLTDLGRVFYFDVGLAGATREGARAATWFIPSASGSGGINPYLFDTDGWTGAPCADPNLLDNSSPRVLPYPGIQQSVDCDLSKSGLPGSLLQNPSGTTCPATSDGNFEDNPPYTDTAYGAGAINQPLLYICYENTPGLDFATAPLDNSLSGQDVNVILVMSFGFATGFMQGVLGNSIHLAVNTHMTVGGF
jgi:hypothetical protein